MALKLPILLLPYPLVVLPAASVTLTIDESVGQQLSALIEESLSPPVVAAVPMVKEPSAEDDTPVFSEWACASRVLHVKFAARNGKDGKYADDKSRKCIVSLQAIKRVQLSRPLKLSSGDTSKLIRLPVQYPPPETTPKRELVGRFKTSALKMLDQLIENSPKSAYIDVFKHFAGMVEDLADEKVLWLADVLVWIVLFDRADRLEFLAAHDTDERLQRAINLFSKFTSVSEVSRKIESAIEESVSKREKEYFLRQRLQAIQRELKSLRPDEPESVSGPSSQSDFDDKHEPEEDLTEIKRKIEAMAPGSEERKMGIREWRRLKRAIPLTMEHGIIMTYLDWLISIPWPTQKTENSINIATLKERTFLAKAKEQLDADHYGLDKIKRRLLEYLAVLRLQYLASGSEVSNGEEKAKGMPAEEGSNSEEMAKGMPAEDVKSTEKDSKEAEGSKVRNDSDNDSPASTPAKASRSIDATKAPILLFVGPPGTGKTSLGKSIAHALNRPFERISLGGVQDEAEIRGFMRTYVASGPGVFVRALRKAGRPDPVIMLDEIDKVSSKNHNGDVSAALLEVLDPEQNHSFRDHYLDVPIDLSQVLFLCTANTLDQIPEPLMDRCEVIHLDGYTYDEKVHIARRFLLPKQLRANSLHESQVSLSDNVLRALATQYTSESGVRSLERTVGAVVRFKAVEWSEAVDAGQQKDYNPLVEEKDLEIILGVGKGDREEKEREPRRGMVYGLSVNGYGEGFVLPVESSMVPGKGDLKLTGSLGDVMKESGELALSWVKSRAYSLHITDSPSQDPLKEPNPIDIHLHLPAGAQKKDGPSGGVAMVCAFVSLLTGKTVPTDVAMTGEITLRGRVTAIGGVKSKALGAHRRGVKKVLFPYANRKDVEQDVPYEVRNSMEFVFVRTIEEALDAAFGKGTFTYRPEAKLPESRL